MTNALDDLSERVKIYLAKQAPLAPYWAGRTFEESLDTPIFDLHSESDRAELYKRLLKLLDHDDPVVHSQALDTLCHNFNLESSEDEEDQPADRIAMHTRLKYILEQIELRLPTKPNLLEQFCSQFCHCLHNNSHHALIRVWLENLGKQQDKYPIPPDTLLANQILFGAYGDRWAEAGSSLVSAIDHHNLTVRACAAYQIGIFCCQLAPTDPNDRPQYRDRRADRIASREMDLLAHYWELIRHKEIERPGVAGAFWHSAPRWTIDANEWLLTLLEQADREPYFH